MDTNVSRFGEDVFLIFIGCSGDAVEEANAIGALEQALGRELERLEIAANGKLPFKKVRFWHWVSDASPLVGGQDAMITPVLDRANAAVFVFKERIGEGTWIELERSRQRAARMPIAAFFPGTQPAIDWLDRTRTRQWTDLLDKKEELTTDWNRSPSLALKPLEYKTTAHLGEIALDHIRSAISEVLQARQEIVPASAPAAVVQPFLGQQPHLTFDRRSVLAHSSSDLEPALVSRLVARPLSRDQVRQMGMDAQAHPTDQLRALGCIADDHPVLGAFLCLARPLLLVDKVGACSLQMVTYNHANIASANASMTVAKGNLLSLFDEGMSWLTRGAGLQRRGGVGRDDRDELEIPEIVLREALANALIHRDYEKEELRDQPTRIDVFPDRVEITSYGKLPQLIDVELLNQDSNKRVPFRRNPVIAMIFQHFGLVELNASGVSRMRQEMERALLAFPRFIAPLHEEVVRVVLLRPAPGGDEPELVPRSLTKRPGVLRAAISSSTMDLPRHHRQQAADACLRQAFLPVFIEDYLEGPDAAHAASRILDDADVLIGIYGFRYNPLAEAELASAVERGLPVLAFMMHDDHPVTRSMVDVGEAQEKLTAFKERVRQQVTVTEFQSPEILGAQLGEALSELELVPKKVEPPAERSESRIATSRLPSRNLLVGRDEEMRALDAAWDGPEKKNVLALVAWGGAGKTAVVTHWAENKLAKIDRGGIECYYDWTFHMHSGSAAHSAEHFIDAALEFFGDTAPESRTAWQRGERLAQFFRAQRSLLILDGLENLQDPKSGELRDESLRALVRSLAASSEGLCVITSRRRMPELDAWRTTAAEWHLPRLSPEEGALLLEMVGVRGTRAELEQLAEDVKGHPLSLTLLGRYLAAAHDGDVRKRDLVSLRVADDEETSGHAFRVIQAYEEWLAQNDRTVELAILRLLALFDRPATPDALAALRASEIAGLTESLSALTDAQWNVAVRRLSSLGLVEEVPWEPRVVTGYGREIASDQPPDLPPPSPFERADLAVARGRSLDTHPLIREYFASRLRKTAPDAWRAAHRRLYEHLSESVPYWPEGLDGLQPLYQAIAHGCHANRHAEALDVFASRVLRGPSGPYAPYSENLGAYGANLAALGCFFTVPWSRLASGIPESLESWLLSYTTHTLITLGRLTEARESTMVAFDFDVRAQNWRNAAIRAANAGELDLALGNLAGAVRIADEAVDYAARSEDGLLVVRAHSFRATVLHQVGRTAEARLEFRKAEELQRGRAPKYLHSFAGVRFCDLLLSDVERAAWAIFLRMRDGNVVREDSLESARKLAERNLEVEEWLRNSIDIAFGHLILGRVALYEEVLRRPARGSGAAAHFDAAIERLRTMNAQRELPRALLARAWHHVVRERSEDAVRDLTEAREIAERGPMPLDLADADLHHGRLFLRQDRAAARDALRRARSLIEKHGYFRRMEELEDAERALEEGKGSGSPS